MEDDFDFDQFEPSWIQDGGIQGAQFSGPQEDLTKWDTDIEVYEPQDQEVNC